MRSSPLSALFAVLTTTVAFISWSATPTQAQDGLNLTVAAIEVTQAVQTVPASVELVAGRPTIVRVTVGVAGASESVAGVKAKLTAKDGSGNALAGTPTVFNDGDSISAPLQPNRDNVNDTLNFVLPSEWTAAGSITLQAEVNPDRTVQEGNVTDNVSAAQTLTFIAVPKLKVVLIPVAYQRNGQGPIYRPDMAQNNGGLGNTQRIFPVADLETQLHAEFDFKGDFQADNGWDQLVDAIGELRDRELPNDSNAMPIYYAVVPQEAVEGLSSFTAGIAFSPPPGPRFKSAGAGLLLSEGVAAHEIAHNFQRSHAPCGGPAAVDPNYPDPAAKIIDAGVEIVNSQPKLHPASETDLLGYCQPQWISAYTYKGLLEIMKAAAAPPPPGLAQTQEDALLVSGDISEATGGGQLRDAVPISSTSVLQGPGAGDYRIELRDGADVAQWSYAFSPVETNIHATTPLSDSFNFVVPRIAGLSSIRLFKGANEIGALQISSGPPTLNVVVTTVPTTQGPPVAVAQSGEADRLQITWETVSPDSTPVEVNLRYSADGGTSWDAIAFNITDSGIEVDKADLEASSNGLIEVTANNRGFATVKVIEIGPVANNPPLASIDEDDQITLDQGDPLYLDGFGFDQEDGDLEGNALSWEITPATGLSGASRPTATETGDTVELPDGLPPGVYNVTLTATDSKGGKSTQSVKVTVQAAPSSGTKVYLPVVRK